MLIALGSSKAAKQTIVFIGVCPCMSVRPFVRTATVLATDADETKLS